MAGLARSPSVLTEHISSYFGVGSLGLGGLMGLWWFARRCRIRKTALRGLLPTVWLAATAIIGDNFLRFVAYLASSDLLFGYI